jgi:FkbM family methyltransferase
MVAVNGAQNIVIHPVGLGHERSKKPFYKPGNRNLATGSFVEGFTPENSYEGELEIQTGDEALAAAGVKSVAIIKMDIEGYEKLALLGLRRTLLRDRPIVEFELTANPNSPVSIKGAQELADLFPKNYKFLVFYDNGTSRMTGAYSLNPIESIVRFDAWAQYDMVAYPAEIGDKLPFKSPRR